MTPKQKRFVDEYLIDLNAAKAARRAGYSPKTADRIGYQNLRKLEIQEEIERRRAEIEEKGIITRDEILRQEKLIATSDIRKLFDDDGNLIPPNELSGDVSAALASIKITENSNGDTVYQYKFWDKGRALERLERILGISIDEGREKDIEAAVKAIENLRVKGS